MTHPTDLIRNRLDRALGLLEEDRLLSLPAEQRLLLREEARKLSGKLDAIESGFLTIGLLGGTGVGKSTLMNSLARSEIATTSHRRPHTDRVLIYRHADAEPIPELGLMGVPWREIAHRGDPIRHILLCDLPDFDSILEDHRQQVIRFLQHLDVLVWVTSPEKYADGRFYEFLRHVPKARQNFYFVLNKVDLLWEGQGTDMGYQSMGEVLESFKNHIHNAGISEPLLYPVSALLAFREDNKPWNQFPVFKQHLFHQRDIKQIAAVKTANLDVEARSLFTVFGKEVEQLERFGRIIDDGLEEISQTRAAWLQSGNEILKLWMDQIQTSLTAQNTGLSPLVGPTYGIGMILQSFQRGGPSGRGDELDLARLAPPEAVSSRFQRRLEWLEDRITNRLLRQNMPQSYRDRIMDSLNTQRTIVEFGERFFDVLAIGLARPHRPPFWGFRIRQVLTYSLLLLLLLLSLGGADAWHTALRETSWGSLLQLIFAGLSTLFSTKGLAALGSYGLLNIFFGFYFYRRYRRLVVRATQKRMAGLAEALGTTWEKQLDAAMQQLETLKEEIRSRQAVIVSLLGDS